MQQRLKTALALFGALCVVFLLLALAGKTIFASKRNAFVINRIEFDGNSIRGELETTANCDEVRLVFELLTPSGNLMRRVMAREYNLTSGRKWNFFVGGFDANRYELVEAICR